MRGRECIRHDVAVGCTTPFKAVSGFVVLKGSNLRCILLFLLRRGPCSFWMRVLRKRVMPCYFDKGEVLRMSLD